MNDYAFGDFVIDVSLLIIACMVTLVPTDI